MIEIRLTNVDVPVRVSMPDPATELLNPTARLVRIEIPKFAALMPEEVYAELSEDPVAMSTYIRSKISGSFKAKNTTWPSPNELRISNDWPDQPDVK